MKGKIDWQTLYTLMSSAARGSFRFVLLLLCTEHPLCTLVAEEGAEEEGERIEERERRKERRKRGREEGERKKRRVISLFTYTQEMHVMSVLT